MARDVPGLYLAGDVTGVPLIKNAINQGRAAAEAVAEAMEEHRHALIGLVLEDARWCAEFREPCPILMVGSYDINCEVTRVIEPWYERLMRAGVRLCFDWASTCEQHHPIAHEMFRLRDLARREIHPRDGRQHNPLVEAVWGSGQNMRWQRDFDALCTSQFINNPDTPAHVAAERIERIKNRPEDRRLIILNANSPKSRLSDEQASWLDGLPGIDMGVFS